MLVLPMSKALLWSMRGIEGACLAVALLALFFGVWSDRTGTLFLAIALTLQLARGPIESLVKRRVESS
jgi:hypothetical protein